MRKIKKIPLFIFAIVLYSIIGMLGLFLIGIIFDFFLFIFDCFYFNTPISILFKDYEVKRLLRMSVGGGITLGISIFIIQLMEMRKR
ncbi:hypothetical protein I4902_12805 [Proteus alimentorum]|uniref:Uncharacterized protein n=1 Tax=Proteus alimentorum TaxID=1973495 RepID=A0ABS0IVU6_9GAMM|nr:hypothetical protein [Proteus alimentorum]MBG2876648.1 hypothetical protein [Proteus alimentorum]MBG2880146.1 hypothetical protein [Proteus alimentorum]